MKKGIFKNKKNLFIALLILFIVLLVWGIIGGDIAQAIGKTCDVGMGDTLCWKWHTNSVGEFGNAVNDFFND